MDSALRRLAFRFAHKEITSEQFALMLVAEIGIRGDNETQMRELADMMLASRPGGDGQ